MPRIRSRFSILAALCLLAAVAAHGADPGPRTWSDSSGQFQVQAVLLDYDGESVQLRKTDGREISVPVARLSRADQQYLENLPGQPDPAPDPFRGGKLPAESSAADAGSTTAGLTPDPGSPRPSLPEGVVDLPLPGDRDKLQPLVTVDAEAGLVLVTVVHVDVNDVTGSTGYLCDLAAGAVKQTVTWEDGIRPLYYDPDADRLIAFGGVTWIGYAESLVAFRGIGNEEVYREPLSIGRSSGPQGMQSATADQATVVVGASSQVFVFDAATGKPRWDAAATVISAAPALSPGGRQLAYQDRFELKIVDVQDGGLLHQRELPTQSALYLGFSPDGTRLAASNVYGLTVWDIRQEDPILQLTSSQPGYEPYWLNADSLLLGGCNYVRIPERLLLWSYRTSPLRWRTGTPVVVAAESMAYVASESNKSLRLVSRQMPHPQAEAAVRNQPRDALMAIPAGSKIALRLQVERGVDDEVAGYVTAALEYAGWQVVPRSPVELVATVRAEPPKDVQYRAMLGGPRDTGDTVKITPFSFLVEIRQGGQTLWERKSLDRPPSLIRLEAGETVQDAADRYRTPNLVFFKSLVLPPEIVKPEFARGLGRSQLGPDGIE